MTANRHLHGGDLDRARQLYGGDAAQWLDLSTGINPVPFPVADLPESVWTALPEAAAFADVEAAARTFWAVPESFEIVVAPGASALIAALPHVLTGTRFEIMGPTYSEHEKAFRHAGWQADRDPDVRICVHPNNPDGRLRRAEDLTAPINVVDESFADVGVSSLVGTPGASMVLKSFGKFWGLAGVRLGFAICRPDIADRLRNLLGPWSASGAALHIASRALRDLAWRDATRQRIAADTVKLDRLMTGAGAHCLGGTNLFRLYQLPDATAWQSRLARQYIWTRCFDYEASWLRVGLPAPGVQFERLAEALR